MDINQFLQNEFSRRQTKNKDYSLRAFAKCLGLPSGRLSEIFNGKRRVTQRVLNQVLEKLPVSPNDKVGLIQSFNEGSKREKCFTQGESYHLVQEDQFQIISDWQHFAILNLANTSDFKSDDQWIAERLGISPISVKLTVNRLIRAGLMHIVHRRTDGDRLVCTQRNFKTSDQVTSPALRIAHSNLLAKAIDSLDSYGIAERDCSSIMMAIDVRKLAEARKHIKVFRRKMAKLLEDGKQTEVYTLNIQLLPITKQKTRSQND